MMHQRLRATGLFVLALVAVTCTDTPTNPDKSNAASAVGDRITLAPTFSASAARIYSGLAAFGLDIAEVHVALTGPGASTKDTTISFPSTLSQIAIDIPIPHSGVDQPFDALVELRNDQHIVLFSGRQRIIARAAYLPRMTTPSVVLEYAGPGKGAKTIAVSPPDTIIVGSVTVPLKATAVDSAKNPVTDLLVSFTVSDATLGVATSTDYAKGTLSGLGRRGVATVTATTPLGVTGSSRIAFVPPAARVVVISGNGQTGVAGGTLAHPLVVQVQATDNLPVPGATVTFRAVTSGGHVHDTTATADTAGRATTTLTLGKAAGTYRFEAASGALTPVSFAATATAAPPAALSIVSGDAQTDLIGVTLQPLVVMVTDQFGGAASGATVNWTRIAGNGTPSAASTVSAADGTASITYTLGNVASTDAVRATIAGMSDTAGTVLFSMMGVIPGPAAIAILSGGNQAAPPNTKLTTPIVARVTDARSNPFANATVIWSAMGAGVTFNPASSVSDATGQVSTQVTLGATPGQTTVMATVGALAATTTITTTGGSNSSTISINAGDQQKVRAGTNVAIAPSVLLKDALGNPLVNAAVVFKVASGGGSVTDASTTTNRAGVATVGSWTLGVAPGDNTLTATAGALSVTFSATGLVPETRHERRDGGDGTR